MQDKVKLLVFLAVWKRPEITELCFQGIERLRKHPDYDVQALAVISEESMVSLCCKYKVNYVLHDNLPVAKKKNYGLQIAKKFEFDYLMEIGSDDLVLNDLLDVYKPLIGKHHFFGIRDLLFVNSENGEARRYISNVSTFGAGRMISRSALEKANWKLWFDKLNRGLDNNSVWNLMKLGIGYKQVKPKQDFPMVIDVKSRDNIWPFSNVMGLPYDFELIVEKLSDQERETLARIIQCTTEQTR